ncbi:hypothetical protein PHET_01345 [Paragonimus heterotremus]|uniref:Protein kinase domain-containing protein n=1 Tax=Paragonimus heterotremus TaxID=100268 RepID=A0A8J4T404_9TREM|nr:hypothetical protein PHET_01345 [Paragonimus heterotremus]
MRLRDIKHAYVARVWEAFMSMDNGNSAVYLSVIRPYVNAPSMKEVLQKHFQKKSIERSLVYHAFGCVLDVLIYLKLSGYSHMNLHPNNVFISNHKAFVTDAWCPNLVTYARGMDFCDLCFDRLYDPELADKLPLECPSEPETQRRKPRHIEWCAPEVAEFQCNDRSDLWSLACMMQIMLNAKDLSEDRIDWALELLKTNPKSFFPLSNRSSEMEIQFVEILLSMLERCPDDRISLEQLLQEPIVQKLLDKTNPEALERAKRCLATTENRPLPFDQGARAVCDYLACNSSHERCVEAAVVWLAQNICRDKSGMPDNLPAVLFSVLDLHHANAKLVQCVMVLLNQAATLGQVVINLDPRTSTANPADQADAGSLDRAYVCGNADLARIIRAMKRHPLNGNIQKSGLRLFDCLVGSERSNITIEVVRSYTATYRHVFDSLIHLGLINHVLGLLHSHTFELALLGAEYLWKYCLYAPIAQHVASTKALLVVMYLMRNYPDEIKLFTGGPLLILALSSLENIQKQLLATDDIIPILLQALQRYQHCPDTIWNVCLGLNALINLSEHFALHFVGNEENTLYNLDGFEVLYSVCKIHHDNTPVIEALMRVVTAMMQHDDIIRGCMGTRKSIRHMLDDVKSRFKAHQVLITAAQRGLQKLNALTA